MEQQAMVRLYKENIKEVRFSALLLKRMLRHMSFTEGKSRTYNTMLDLVDNIITNTKVMATEQLFEEDKK